MEAWELVSLVVVLVEFPFQWVLEEVAVSKNTQQTKQLHLFFFYSSAESINPANINSI